jgi:uncharacterized protein
MIYKSFYTKRVAFHSLKFYLQSLIMNSYYQKIFSYLVNINIFKLILVAIVLSLLNDLIIRLIVSDLTSPSEINDLKKEGLGFFAFIVLIIGPFIETIIFQTFTIFIVQNILKIFNIKYSVIPIVISGLLFGISHWYNLPYIILMSIRGVIYAWFFIIIQKRPENATLIIFIVHSLNNLVVFLDDNIL